MSLYQVKIVIAAVFLGAAFTALVSMLELTGRLEKKGNPQSLRKIHKSAGLIFGSLLLPLLWIGAKFAARAGDGLPPRGILHAVLALFLIALFLLKAAFARRYRGLLKHVPVMGLALFVLAAVVFMMSAGFSALKRGSDQAAVRTTPAVAAGLPEGDAGTGAALFAANCISCHRNDVDTPDYAPGLKGVLKRSRLPSSGRPATAESIRALLITPVAKMPSFAALSEKEMADIIAYLKTI